MAEVYLLRFPSNKCYVGRTKTTAQKRLRTHIGNAIRRNYDNAVHRAIRKYGSSNIVLEVLAKNLSWSESACVEQKMIEIHRTMYPNGYNLTIGGEGVGGLLPEAKQRQYAGALRGLEKQSRQETIKRWQEAGANSRRGVRPTGKHLEAIRKGAAKGRAVQAKNPELQKLRRKQLAEGRKTSWSNPELREKMLANLRRGNAPQPSKSS